MLNVKNRVLDVDLITKITVIPIVSIDTPSFIHKMFKNKLLCHYSRSTRENIVLKNGGPQSQEG